MKGGGVKDRSSRSAASRLTIQLRIALVSVVFVLGLVLIGMASWTGSGRLTAAFEDHKAYSALAARSREVRAASFALKAQSRDVRFRQEATDINDVKTGLESLKQAVARLVEGLFAVCDGAGVEVDPAALFLKECGVGRDFDCRCRCAERCSASRGKQDHMGAGSR